MGSPENRIRIVVFAGSVRPGNYTAKATALVVDELQKQEGVSVESIDPAHRQLPLPGTDAGSAAMEELRDKVSNAAGVVLATPEYHGSFSSVMKLIIENLGFPSVLAGKPVALLGVAAGAIGAIKSLEQLRSVCSHIGAIAKRPTMLIAYGVDDSHADHVFEPFQLPEDDGPVCPWAGE